MTLDSFATFFLWHLRLSGLLHQKIVKTTKLWVCISFSLQLSGYSTWHVRLMILVGILLYNSFEAQQKQYPGYC